jgi:hypothetical protein
MTYLTSNGERYIPDHIRLTGIKKRKQVKLGTAFDKEMQEIREMEINGEILVDGITETSVRLDQKRREHKRKVYALRKNRA